jgi:glycine dehydrogenase subunit 1
MYDAATGAAEAAMMANRVTRRNRTLYMSSLNPQTKEVLKTYSVGADFNIEEINEIPSEIPSDVSCVIVQQPDFFGSINDLEGLAQKVQGAGGLLAVIFDPISLGLIKTPGDLGADIAVGEGQALGNAMNFGGPYLGVFCAKTKYIRQMPGRLVGMTTDTKGQRAFVLTLATREQHIRREKATSNICSNEGLVALGANVYMAVMGKNGLKRVAEICYNRSHYLADQISKIPGFSLANDKPFFKEFVVKCPKSPSEINKRLLEEKIIGGLDISDQVPNGWLLCVTEMNSRKQLDKLVEVLKGL